MKSDYVRLCAVEGDDCICDVGGKGKDVEDKPGKAASRFGTGDAT